MRLLEVGRWVLRRRSAPYVRLPRPLGLFVAEAWIVRDPVSRCGVQLVLEPDGADLAGCDQYAYPGSSEAGTVEVPA